MADDGANCQFGLPESRGLDDSRGAERTLLTSIQSFMGRANRIAFQVL